jgi:hypothetical protein
MPSAQRPLKAFSSFLGKSEYSGETSAPLSTFETAAAKLENFAQKASDAATAAGKSDLDDTGLAVTFGGEASAYGDATLAQASISGNVVDVGLVTYALGTTSFTATATSSGETTAFAVTDSFASVTGADLVLTIDRDQATPITPEMEYASSTSTTTFVAIDLEFWDFRNGPIVIEGSSQPASCAPAPDGGSGGTISGNIATLEARLDVTAENSFTAVDAQVLAVENTLSTVTVVGVMAVG